MGTLVREAIERMRVTDVKVAADDGQQTRYHCLSGRNLRKLEPEPTPAATVRASGLADRSDRSLAL
ncbi:hypothetical protein CHINAEXTREME_18915 [Halobiforma lacisalsi AJ5]|uniref:Uncharacterized protein n=1 Tax=Natronobacterium lacisalsi AJ5 TaxID=358396 RepID=M0LUR8_NATLA|nr:hypothetical protein CHINAEXTREME_18915 [Halobiforma lacisalsi AJ5]EMA36114.1 hypothetical protein C445_04633 [Halobiforma lacisalsi AJ5]